MSTDCGRDPTSGNNDDDEVHDEEESQQYLEVGEGREDVWLERGELVTTQYQLLQSGVVRK